MTTATIQTETEFAGLPAGISVLDAGWLGYHDGYHGNPRRVAPKVRQTQQAARKYQQEYINGARSTVLGCFCTPCYEARMAEGATAVAPEPTPEPAAADAVRCAGYIGGGRIIQIYRCTQLGYPRRPGGKPLCDAHAKVNGQRIQG